MPRGLDVGEIRTFPELLADAFVYPMRREGKYLLLVGAASLWIVGILSRLPFVGLLFLVPVAAFMAAYLFRIIAHSAKGDTDLPDWPDPSELGSPLFFVMGALGICSLPAVTLWFLHRLGYVHGETAIWIAATAGGFFLPMALLAVALSQTLDGLNPVFLVKSILRIPVEYLSACAILALVVAIELVASPILERLPFIGPLAGDFGALYFLAVEMRILGIIYYTRQHKLDWFGEALS